MVNIPKHIAVVPDGNRRFAKKQGKLPADGHRAGADNFKNLLEWCKEYEIPELSFWALSTENLQRDALEVKFLFSLFKELCDQVIEKHAMKQLDDVRIRFCGALNLLPRELADKMRKVEELTKNNSSFKLNLLVAYGGREELMHVIKRFASERPADITEEMVKKHLYVESDVDLVIRTGHACLSGLFPWQASYAEIVFLEKFWPEFTKEDFKAALEEFSIRKRSFGK